MFQVNLVEPLLLGFAFCLYATVSLEQQLIYRKTCVQQFNSTYCEILYKTKNETFKGDQDFVQKKTSQWVIYNSIVRAVPSIVTTLMLTVKFDRIGRKRIMILPIIGGIIVTINYILNAHYMEWPVAWMLIGVFLDASFGQYPALLAAVFAYLADTTSNENRTIRTIILESMLFIGGLISEITSGLLLQYYGFFPPFILVLSVYVCLFVYWFFLKESYPPSENKEQRSFCQELKSKLVNEAYRIIFKQPQKFATRRIVVLLTCFIFSFFIMAGPSAVTILYILRSPINFSPENIGFFTAEISGIRVLGTLLANYFFLYLMRWPDNSTLLMFGVTSAGFFLSMAFSVNQWQIYATGAWSLGMGLGVSTIRGKLSKMMGKTEQGVLSSILACLEILFGLVASLTSSVVYKATVDILPSTIYFIFASISLVVILLTGLLMCFEKTNDDEYEDMDKPINTE